MWGIAAGKVPKDCGSTCLLSTEHVRCFTPISGGALEEVLPSNVTKPWAKKVAFCSYGFSAI